MSSTHDAVTASNAELIQGLREVADWMEQHAELPQFFATIGHYAHGQEAREALATVAAALGERAAEQVDRDRVFIKANFAARVIVVADASVRYLGGIEPPAPVYEPIIQRRSVMTTTRPGKGS